MKMKYVCLLLACVLMLVGLSLPAFAADGDPFSGDSADDIWVDGLPSPEPIVTDTPVVEVLPSVPDEMIEPEVIPDDETTSDPEEILDDGSDPNVDPGLSGGDGITEIPVIESGPATVIKNMALFSSDYTPALMEAIYAVFGEYTPRTYTVITYLDDGSAVESVEIVPGLAGLDYNWLAGVALFTLVLYCIFRMIGGLFRWK